MFLAVALLSFCYVSCDNTCTTRQGKPGNCINLIECEEAMKLLRSLHSTKDPSIVSQLRSEHCGFVNNLPKVCCQNKYKHKNLHLLPEKSCGLNAEDRLIGGDRAQLDEFTWNVLLSYKMKNGTQFQCGGSLINEKYVLTAAECINDNLVAVRIGERVISSALDCDGFSPSQYCSGPPQDIEITSAVKHEQYSETTHDNNIGLIRLNRTVETDSTVRPVCLPVDQVLEIPNFERPVLVVGWGATSQGVAEDSLLKIHLKVLTNEECNMIYNRTLLDVLSENKLCAGVVVRHICPGDTGGPLIYKQLDGVFVQVGIVNYKQEDCGLGRPGVYTRITKPVLDWILHHMSA